MGAKDWFICYADDDVPSVLATRTAYDRAATEALVPRLFPGQTVTPDRAGTLGGDANPDDDMVYAAVWPGATIVCTSRAALNRPSELEARFLAEGRGRTVHVHAMHSAADWFALGVWGADGKLRRALSVNGAEGALIEDAGDRLAFEEPFWAGDFPATDDGDYPFPFHPLALSEAALHHLFGFVFEGYAGMTSAASVDPYDVPLAGYRLTAGEKKRGFFRRR